MGGGLGWGFTRGLLPLFLAKSFSFLDGEEQLLFQLFKALVRRQVQTIETVKTKRLIDFIRKLRATLEQNGPPPPTPIPLTMCGFEGAMSPSPPSQCRTSVDRYFLWRRAEETSEDAVKQM